ncbi:MAG TPA: hypothetical protein VGD26_03395 [Chitinophagaceae bacterium]
MTEEQRDFFQLLIDEQFNAVQQHRVPEFTRAHGDGYFDVCGTRITFRHANSYRMFRVGDEIGFSYLDGRVRCGKLTVIGVNNTDRTIEVNQKINYEIIGACNTDVIFLKKRAI